LLSHPHRPPDRALSSPARHLLSHLTGQFFKKASPFLYFHCAVFNLS